MIIKSQICNIARIRKYKRAKNVDRVKSNYLQLLQKFFVYLYVRVKI